LRNEDYKDKGMIYFTESVNSERATNLANTHILSVSGRDYVIDTSCGKKRYREIKEFLKERHDYSILCTHYHNDHIANNGRFARAHSPIIYHCKARSKISNLRTNSYGQVLVMYRDMDKEGFLKRLGMFNDTWIKLLLKRKIYSRYITRVLLYAASIMISLKSIGRIYTGKKYVRYLEDVSRTGIEFDRMKADAWKIDDSLYAFETPGHSDDHIVFYLQSTRLLVAGDALNFLTPNDIQFGTVKETIETQKFLLDLVKNENIEILCQGHYPPLTGNDKIVDYISGIIEKHEHMYALTTGFLRGVNTALTFDEIYERYCAIDDPLINRLKKITFPRSTLVFLDVYLLKMLQEAGIEPGEGSVACN